MATSYKNITKEVTNIATITTGSPTRLEQSHASNELHTLCALYLAVSDFSQLFTLCRTWRATNP